MEYKELKKIMAESLDILIPEFSELYGLELKAPATNTSKKGYMKSLGDFRPFEEAGIMRINEDECKNKRTAAVTTAHEMGHSAFYQYNVERYDKISGIYPVHCLNEGIACDFEEEGMGILKRKGYIGARDFFIEYYHLQRKVSFLSFAEFEYHYGARAKNRLKKRGIKIKDMILNPLEYVKEVESAWSYRFFGSKKRHSS